MIEAGNSSSLNCSEEVELADLLCEIHPWADMVRLARTGGESMTIAVRIARAYTGKDKIAFWKMLILPGKYFLIIITKKIFY